MASQRASITKELLRESLESVLKPFKIHSLADGKFSCVLESLMRHKVFVNRPTGSGTQLVVSNIRLFSRAHSPRARCKESVLSGWSGIMPPVPRKFRFNCLDRPVQCTHIHNNCRINFSIISESAVTYNNNNSG